MLDYHHQRLVKIEYALFKTDETPTIFQEIFKRFIDNEIKHLEDKQELENKFIHLNIST